MGSCLWGVAHDVLLTFLELRVEVLQLDDKRALVSKEAGDKSNQLSREMREFSNCCRQQWGQFAVMLLDGIWSFVGCLAKNQIILAFPFLVHKTAHTDSQEAHVVMERFVVGAGFELVVDDVLQQCAVLEMLEHWDVFCNVLKEGPQHHFLGWLVGVLP